LTCLDDPSTPNNAATIIYPGSTGDKWWDMQQLCNQVTHKAIPIFKKKHPDSQAVFVFDCSSAHGAYTPSALQAQNMNLSYRGKRSWLQESVIPPMILMNLLTFMDKYRNLHTV
jgi:hypothetical protein